LTTFKTLGLSEDILKALSELGFETPTEIQTQAIPILLEGDHDFIGLAQTGTGKTAAFGLPLLELIDPQNNATQALVLAPTRELGQQIAEQLEKYSKYMDKVNVLAVYGGAAITNQIRALRNPQHVIIATPGRLIDLVERKAIKLDQVKYLVLDEADEMLNMGFKDELDTILSFTSDQKNTWLFSATMPSEIKKIVKKYMENPVEAKVNVNNEANKNIEHQYAIVKQSNKIEAITRFLDINPDMRGLVFCRTRQDTQDLAEVLMGKGYKADALHGDMSQQQRDRVMKRFKSHDLHVLIATDVAARGIDVNDLTHVFHFTLPDDNAYYTHRSGRTARAGKKGISVAFISAREPYKLRQFEKQLGITFEQIEIPNTDNIAAIRIENWAQGIAAKEFKTKLDKTIVKTAITHFEEVSKDELIEKLIHMELEKLNLDSSGDLNQKASDRDGGGDGRRGGGGRNRSGGGGDRRDRGGFRGGNNRGGGDRDRGRGRDRGDRERSDRDRGADRGDRSKSFGGDRNNRTERPPSTRVGDRTNDSRGDRKDRDRGGDSPVKKKRKRF